MKPPIISSDVPLTFADYFKLNAEVDEVVAYFGYQVEAQTCALPHTDRPLEGVEGLKTRLQSSLPHFSLTSETARREFLIAPILMELVQYIKGRVRVEYPIVVSPQLQGTLDYLVQTNSNLLVIEAKYGDLTRGFTQLAVELIALDRWTESGPPLLYGTVSTGNAWQFGVLDRSVKKITQDLNLFGVPTDLEALMRILVGILSA